MELSDKADDPMNRELRTALRQRIGAGTYSPLGYFNAMSPKHGGGTN